jgi:arylsulfatase
VIVANGDEMGGYALWVDDEGLLRHSYSMLGVEHYSQVATEKLPTGDITVRMQFNADEHKPATGGTASLYVDDVKVGEGRIDRTVPVAFSSYAGMDVGRDNGLVVDSAYRDRAPYRFTGTVKKVVFDLKPAHHEDEKALHEATQHASAAQAATA